MSRYVAHHSRVHSQFGTRWKMENLLLLLFCWFENNKKKENTMGPIEQGLVSLLLDFPLRFIENIFTSFLFRNYVNSIKKNLHKFWWRKFVASALNKKTGRGSAERLSGVFSLLEKFRHDVKIFGTLAILIVVMTVSICLIFTTVILFLFLRSFDNFDTDPFPWQFNVKKSIIPNIRLDSIRFENVEMEYAIVRVRLYICIGIFFF